MEYNYNIAGKTKNEAINELIDEVISFMNSGDIVTVDDFGKGKFTLDMRVDDDGDFRFWTMDSTSDVYESNLFDPKDIGAIRKELEEAWDSSLLEICHTRETGGNILTIDGVTMDGYFFVCDQYGDGVVLDEEYDPEWTYDEYLGHRIDVLDADNAREILALIKD